MILGTIIKNIRHSGSLLARIQRFKAGTVEKLAWAIQ